jgi:hypothetical protein
MPNVDAHKDEVHFVDGLPIVAKMIKRRCPVMCISFEPFTKKDSMPKCKILVLFEGQHNHPPLPQHKLMHPARQAVGEAFEAVRGGGITAGRLLNGECQYVCLIVH